MRERERERESAVLHIMSHFFVSISARKEEHPGNVPLAILRIVFAHPG